MTYDKSNILKSQKQIIIMLLREMLISEKSLKRGFQKIESENKRFNHYFNMNFPNQIIESLLDGDAIDSEKLAIYIENVLKENPFRYIDEFGIVSTPNEEMGIGITHGWQNHSIHGKLTEVSIGDGKTSHTILLTNKQINQMVEILKSGSPTHTEITGVRLK